MARYTYPPVEVDHFVRHNIFVETHVYTEQADDGPAARRPVRPAESGAYVRPPAPVEGPGLAAYRPQAPVENPPRSTWPMWRFLILVGVVGATAIFTLLGFLAGSGAWRSASAPQAQQQAAVTQPAPSPERAETVAPKTDRVVAGHPKDPSKITLTLPVQPQTSTSGCKHTLKRVVRAGQELLVATCK